MGIVPLDPSAARGGRPAFGARVALQGLTRRYGSVRAVEDLSLEASAGEFLTLLGPSGSGKTTALMMIAGLVEPTAGRILVGERDVTRMPPRLRNIGVVFQHYALFPHMTVAENVAYPLRMRRVRTAEVRTRVGQALELVQLASLGHRYTNQLSGGQQQRVAIARALVFEPPLLLLDEPLGALDRNLRESMQQELRGLKERLGLTVIHVTHDQTEALAMSDRIAVMHEGRLEQVGTPQELYEQPRTAFIARFLGESTRLRGRIAGLEGGEAIVRLESGLELRAQAKASLQSGAPVVAMMRPERVHIQAAAGWANEFPAIVADVVYGGESIRVVLRLASGDQVSAVVQNNDRHLGTIARGQAVHLSWRAEDVHLFPVAEDGRSDGEIERPASPHGAAQQAAERASVT